MLQREASALDSVRRDGTAHSVCVQADANFNKKNIFCTSV